MKRQFFALTAIAVFLAAMFMIPPSSGAQTVTLQTQRDGARKGTPTARTATWTGNGAYYDEGDFTLSDSRCEESEGEPYLYWVLTAGGRETINSATITIDGSGPYTMTREANGSFKYTQTFGGTPESFVVPVNVTAAYTRAKSANLVISHGCTGEVPVVPSFSLSFEDGVDGIYSFLGTDCVEGGKGENFGVFSEYEGQTFEVCATPANGYNVGFLLIPGSTVTSSPEANCSPVSVKESPMGGLEGPAGEDAEYWLCLVTEPDTVITISAGVEPPPPPPACTADPTSGVEYEVVLQGMNGSVDGVAFTNQTVTFRGVANVSDAIPGNDYGLNYYKTNMPVATLTITGTSISGGASVDGGMGISTEDFGGGVAGMFWQAGIASGGSPSSLTWDLVSLTFNSGIGTTYPVQSERLIKCWTATFGSDTTGSLSGQWNGNPDSGTPPSTVNGGTSVTFSNAGVERSGYMSVRPFDNTLVINRFER